MTGSWLEVRGLRKTFGGVRALNCISCAFDPGETVGLVGPNGAGKTTLLNIVTGFLPPDEGTVIIREEDTTHLAPHQIARRGVARTFQDPRLVRKVPVLENVMLARPAQSGEQLVQALIGIGVSKEENANRRVAIELLRLVGLEEWCSKNAGELSYGQQKLLTLACCLATEAPILLLDEPLSGLHPEIADRARGLLVRARDEGKLVVFIEHDLASVREIANRVVVMDGGNVIADGEPGDVLSRKGTMEAFVA